MAWTDSCKIEAINLIKKKTEEAGSVRAACKVVSEESDIPASTLRDWYKYPEGRAPVGDVSPTGQKAGKALQDKIEGPKPQAEIWGNVSRRLATLRKYIGENCDIPAEIPPGIFLNIDDHLSFIHECLGARDAEGES